MLGHGLLEVGAYIHPPAQMEKKQPTEIRSHTHTRLNRHPALKVRGIKMHTPHAVVVMLVVFVRSWSRGRVHEVVVVRSWSCGRGHEVVVVWS